MKLINLKIVFFVLLLVLFLVGEVGEGLGDTGDNPILRNFKLKIVKDNDDYFKLLDNVYIIGNGIDPTTGCDGVTNFEFDFIGGDLPSLNMYIMAKTDCSSICGKAPGLIINSDYKQQCDDKKTNIKKSNEFSSGNVGSYHDNGGTSIDLPFSIFTHPYYIPLENAFKCEREFGNDFNEDHFPDNDKNRPILAQNSGMIKLYSYYADDDWGGDSPGYFGPISIQCKLKNNEIIFDNLNTYQPINVKGAWKCNDIFTDNGYYHLEICGGGVCKRFDKNTNELEFTVDGQNILILNPKYYFVCDGTNLGIITACYGDSSSGCYATSETSCDDGIDNDGNGETDCWDTQCCSETYCYNKGNCMADSNQGVCTNMGGDWTDISRNKCCGDDKLTGGYENIGKPSELGLEGPDATIHTDEGESSVCLMGDNCLKVTPIKTTTSFGIYKDIYDTLKTGISRYVLTGFLKSSSPSDQGSTRVLERMKNIGGEMIISHFYYNGEKKPPTVYFRKPSNNSLILSDNTITFDFTVATNFNLNCSVYLDGEEIKNYGFNNRGFGSIFDYGPISYGKHSWTVKCIRRPDSGDPDELWYSVDIFFEVLPQYKKFVSDTDIIKNKWLLKTAVVPDRGHIDSYDEFRAYPIFFYNSNNLLGKKFYSDETYLIPYSDMGKTNDKNDPTTMCTYIQPDLQTKKWSWKDASTTPFKIFPIGWTIDSISNGTKWFYCDADETHILRQGELEGPIPIKEYSNVPYTPSEEDQMGLYKCSDYFGSGGSAYYFRAGYFCSDCEAYFDSIGSTPDFCNDNDAGNDNNPPCCNEGNCIDNSVCEGEGTGENNDIDTWQCIINPESCFSDSDDGWQNSNCSSHDGVICNENQFCLGGEFVNALDSSSCCVDGTCVDYGELTCSQLGGYVCDSSKNEVCLGNSFGTSDTSQETLTCCNKPCEYFFSDIRNYNRGESFICYNNDNRNLIAECNSGALNNPNRQNFSILNGIYQDNSVFTTGSSLYSIFTNDKVEGSSLLDKSRIISDFNEYYLDGPTNNYILLTTQNSNWSGFDYLEMGVIFNNANINISLVPVKGDEINLGKLTQYAIDKETANYVFVPHHISIKFNETLKQTLKQTRIANINFTNTNTGNTKPTIIIDKIKLTKVNDNNKPQKDYYCSGTFGKWINGLNPPDTIDFNNFEEFGPYMVACKMNFGFDWTGTKCCGYDSSYGEPEYYNDALMGCWGGTPVKNDQTVSNATKSLTYYPNELFYNSNFTACIYDADVTDIDNENIAQACEVKGSHFCSPEAKWKKIFEGTDLGVYYEEDNELKIRTPEIKWAPPGWNWYEDRDREENCVDYGDHEECTYQKVIQISQENPYSNFDSSLDLPLNQNPGKNYESGCCPDDYCWNGTQCVSYKDYLDANVAPIWWDGQEMGYRCTLNSSGVANWELSYQKESYDEKNYGWCPGDTCYYSSSHEPQCVQPGFYDGDPYCLGGIKGNWTRRVFMIAEELLNLTTNTYQAEDYSIYCGAQNDALNNIQGIPNINGACVLNTESNTIFGTSLNQNFSQNFKNILSIYMINASCENKENYDSCSLSPYDEKPTDDKYKVYYDNKTKIIFVSRESITLNPGWFNTFWNKLINLFKSKNPKVTNFKYENFYHIKNNTKTIHAIYKPSKYIQINYSGFEEQTLNLICNQIISETDDNESCKIIGDSIIINTTASQLKNEWIDLTSKTRINIVD